MKRLLISACVLFAMTGIARAEPQVVAYTGSNREQLICNAASDHTNLRSAPTAKNSQIYRALENGEQVEIESIVTNDAGAVWYEVVWAADDGDVMGYVVAAAVKPHCGSFDIVEGANTDYTPLADPTATLVKPGTCELIVAARPSLDEAKSYAAGISDKRFLKIFQSQNGWYAVSIGALTDAEEKPIMKKWKASGKIPSDAYCSTGEKYVTGMKWEADVRATATVAAQIHEAPSGGGLAGALLRGMVTVIDRAESPSSDNSTYTAPYDYCYSSDQDCYSIVEQDGNELKIRCTKGSRSISPDPMVTLISNSKGYWGDDGFFYHWSSINEAVHNVCG